MGICQSLYRQILPLFILYDTDMSGFRVPGGFISEILHIVFDLLQQIISSFPCRTAGRIPDSVSFQCRKECRLCGILQGIIEPFADNTHILGTKLLVSALLRLKCPDSMGKIKTG